MIGCCAQQNVSPEILIASWIAWFTRHKELFATYFIDHTRFNRPIQRKVVENKMNKKQQHELSDLFPQANTVIIIIAPFVMTFCSLRSWYLGIFWFSVSILLLYETAVCTHDDFVVYNLLITITVREQRVNTNMNTFRSHTLANVSSHTLTKVQFLWKSHHY